MRCILCHNGETAPGLVTVTMSRGETAIIFKNIPADVCDVCGEYYLSQEVTGKILEQAQAAIKTGNEVEIIRWAA